MYTKTQLPHAPTQPLEADGPLYSLLAKYLLTVPHMPLGVFLVHTTEGHYWYANIPYSPAHGPYTEDQALASIALASEDSECAVASAIENQYMESTC